jgi:hypothetical protein
MTTVSSDAFVLGGLGVGTDVGNERRRALLHPCGIEASAFGRLSFVEDGIGRVC